jgi:hypothetical protein
LRASLQSAHPSVVATGTDVLDGKATQIVTAEQLIGQQILIVPVLLKADIGLVNLLGEPLREYVFPRDAVFS